MTISDFVLICRIHVSEVHFWNFLFKIQNGYGYHWRIYGAAIPLTYTDDAPSGPFTYTCDAPRGRVGGGSGGGWGGGGQGVERQVTWGAPND